MSRFIPILVVACFAIHATGYPENNLQSLINAAGRGDTVLVSPGRYDGNITVDKPLTLLGLHNPLLRGDSAGIVITITADSCRVEGFSIERSGDNLMHEDAGILIKSNHNTISGNTLRDVLFGIYLLEADSNLVERNTIVGRWKPDLGQRGSGIHIWNSHHNGFVDNSITETRDGFYIQYAHHTLIERNQAFGLRYGVHYMYADSNTFTLNRFTDNVAGAAIMYSRDIRMRHNIFSHNRGFASFGILFQDCHGMIADSNVVSDNVVGIFFESTTDNLFRHNVIAQNDVALQMFQNSIGNTFTENNFIDNLNPLLMVGKRTGTRWNFDGRGNYWSSYKGYDVDGNGIGDVPMKIQNTFQYLEGQNANLRLYLYSPASQALGAAAEAFPIIAVNSEEDNHPLMTPVALASLPAVVTLTEGAAPRAAGLTWIALPMTGALLLGFLYHVISRRGLQ
jgi:nitrous oxidase accessory protein